ncbi:hypothetical protein H2203_008114 [Taxawa tesnikishii (nom. ined.)]|nr:hypothetical protein H2203_008114 [Dothideales sp. JES 119]
MSSKPSLDAHARPPDHLRILYKRYQKMKRQDLDADDVIFDHRKNRLAGFTARSVPQPPLTLQIVFSQFLQSPNERSEIDTAARDFYEHPLLPGLLIYPSLLPSAVQTRLLDKLLHRDLADPVHQTNIHLHYDISYPPDHQSFFSPSAGTLTQVPKDPGLHKPLSITSLLNKKLRWITLGGQYDWTQKAYPDAPPPEFPRDVGALVEGLFPDMKAQAAICNLYSPGDTLSLHRDVSEECDRPLVSVSLGCDGIFLAALEDVESGEGKEGKGNPDGKAGKAPRVVVTRLSSGDVVVMSGEARFAWHAVPQIVAESCPEWMAEWPFVGDVEKGNEGREGTKNDGERFEVWKGWMAGKRVNLNVRQMRN